MMKSDDFHKLLQESCEQLINGPVTIRAHMKDGNVIEYEVKERTPENEQKAFEKAYEEFYGIKGDEQDA